MAQLVKTVGGLAIASVKTVMGLAVASVKTINGLDNTGGGGGATLVFTDSFSATTATAVTLTAADLGAAASDREILVCVIHRNGFATSSPSAVTVGGVSATLVAGVTSGGSPSVYAQIWRASVPSGTTGNVVATCVGLPVWTNLAVYRATGLASGAADTGTGTTNATNSTTLTAAAGAVALACSGGATAGGPTATWTNLSEDYDVLTDASSDTATSASAEGLAGETTVTAAITGTVTAFAAASFDPL